MGNKNQKEKNKLKHKSKTSLTNLTLFYTGGLGIVVLHVIVP
jgi:hypothetical protein